MIWTIAKAILAATVITAASSLAGKRPVLAGFITALPLASLLALAFAQIEHGNDDQTITYAKSILIGVPVSYLFFVPFFAADKLGWSFWTAYAVGLGLLGAGFFLHRWLAGHI